MPKIKLDIDDLKVPQVVVKLQNVVTNMTGNATFSAISTKTTALGTATTALQAANGTYEDSKADTDTKLTLRDDARTAAEDAYRTLAAAAEGVTTDEALLQSGGWDLRGAPSPVGNMPAPQSVSATGGDNEGEVDLSCDSIRGVQTFIAEVAPNPAGPWTQFYVGRPSSCTATGLTSGTQYWFRMRAVGAAGPGPWSDPATKRAT